MHPPHLFAFISLLSLTLASPTPIAPRASCTTQAPSILQLLSESSPNTTFPNLALQGGHFLVSSSSSRHLNRTDQAVAFTNIPAGSWGCSLMLIMPSSPRPTIHTIGHPTLEIRTLDLELSKDIQDPNAWSWGDLRQATTSAIWWPRRRETPSSDPIAATASLFGTLSFFNPSVAAASSTSSSPSPTGTVSPPSAYTIQTINTQACPTDLNGGGNLAFLFSVAPWVEGDAAVYFNTLEAEGLMGVYLTYNC